MICVYASKKNVEAVAFADGLRVNGHAVKELNASDYGAGQVIPCDICVIAGTRSKGATILADHEAAGIPVIVIDYGYLHRVSGVATWQTGHWQIGIGGLNRPPRFPCSDDRIKKLSMRPAAPRTSGVSIVLGQHSGDPSHGFTDQQMSAWAQAKCDDTGGYWRPHPDSPHIHVSAPRADGDFGAWLGRASIVYTICSTGGLEALIAGVAAVADMPARACWGELSGEDHPGSARVWELCKRLAYGQWTLAEMRSGEAAKFIIGNLERWHES